MIRSEVHKWRWRLLSAWIVIFTVVNFWGLQAIRDDQHNIQKSRVFSCERTYHSFTEMFQPFFPPDPKKWTPRQKSDWAKLQNRAAELAAKCPTQTQP